MPSYSKILKHSLKELGVSTYGKRSTGKDGDETPETDDKFQDFPYIEDPKPFITHRAMESFLYEQEPEQTPEQELETDPGQEQEEQVAQEEFKRDKEGNIVLDAEQIIADALI